MSQRKQNYWGFYIALVILGGVLLFFSLRHPVRKGNLYGVVESPKVRLNHPRKVAVLKVTVSPGQKVQRGDLLMQLSSDAVTDDLQTLAFREKQLESDLDREVFQLEIEEEELQLELLQAGQIRTQEKKEIEMALARDQLWIKNFATTAARDTVRSVDWRLAQIEEIYQSKQAEIRLKQTLLHKKKQLVEISYLARKEELMMEKERLLQEKASLMLMAPASGTIDNVYFMEGQTADAFTNLLSLLPDENKYIRAYITEQTSADESFSKVEVQSILNREKATTAVYIGSGGVELLPAQIQDAPVQLSGKEVFFKLDNAEGWLQGEKVMIILP